MSIKAIVGLGNSGAEYEKNDHNVGQVVARALREFRLCPGTGYMNESGGPVAKWLKMNNLTPADIIVIHDDADLLLGSYKLAAGGSSAGHNGVQSVIDNLGTADFLRLRIGIRRPDEPVRKKALEFVLQHFSDAEEAVFAQTLEKALPEVTGLFQTSD